MCHRYCKAYLYKINLNMSDLFLNQDLFQIIFSCKKKLFEACFRKRLIMKSISEQDAFILTKKKC